MGSFGDFLYLEVVNHGWTRMDTIGCEAMLATWVGYDQDFLFFYTRIWPN